MRQVVAAIVLTAVVAALAWFNLRERQTVTSGQTARVDQRFTDFTGTQFGQDGAVRWKLTGNRLEHLTRKAGYRIQQPAFSFHDEKQPGPPWTLTAPTGTADNDLKKILLSGGVVGKRAAWDNHGQLNLRTAELTIKPNQRKASSQTDTTFSETRPDGGGRQVWRSHSQGFALDYNSQILQQSRVDDRLEPHRDAGQKRHQSPRTTPPISEK